MQRRGTAERGGAVALERFAVRLLACRDAAEHGELTPRQVGALARAAAHCGASDPQHRAGDVRTADLRRIVEEVVAVLERVRTADGPWSQALLLDAVIEVADDTLR